MLGLTDKQKRLFIDVLVTLVILGLMTVLFINGTFQSLDWKLFDALMNIRRSTPVQRDNVVIVCIDEKSLGFFLGHGVDWPWPREFYAYLARYLSEYGAKAVVFDAIFSDPDLKNVGSDANFSEAIKDTEKTYLVAGASLEAEVENPYDNSIFIKNEKQFEQFDVRSYESGIFPIPAFARGAKGIGLSTAVHEDDGIFRRYVLVLKIHEKYLPSLGYVVVRDILGEETLNNILFDDKGESILADEEGKLLINWYGKAGPEDGVFTYYSFHAVIGSSQQIERGQKPVIPPEVFKDKIVIIGSNAEGLLDLKATPFSSKLVPYPGMEIHATAIENFLANDFIRRMPSWMVFLLMALGAAGMFAAFKLIKGIRLYVAVYAVCIAAEVAIAYWLLTNNIWLKWIEVFGATTFSFAGLVISGYFSESKDKKILRRTFERYVSDSVLERIFENPDAVDFEGRDITATVMATDIQGFTSISESLPAYEVVSLLNDYLSEVSETLIDNGAFINKYIGDAILAVYGAFGSKEHQRSACLAGLAAMRVIERKIREAEGKNLPPLITRIGVSTGDLTMGNIGSARKLEFTVIGDTVNSAFRLEGINKYYNTHFLISEYTKEGVGDGFEFRLIDSLRFKGKDKSVRVYEILGMEGQVSSEKLRQRDEFEDAIAFYSEGNFTRALEMFSKLADEGDAPSQVLKSRCEVFIKNPPGQGWNGVWTMYSK